MVVIERIMAVAVHCPDQIFFQPMRMAMGCNGFGVLLERFKNSRHMGRGRKDAPQNNQNTGQGSNPLPCLLSEFRNPRHVPVVRLS